MPFSLADVLNLPTLRIYIWEEDGVYIAKCPDIPGCISEGATRDEAKANIHDAISLCLDVIREDRANLSSEPAEVEVIEAPLSDFLDARR